MVVNEIDSEPTNLLSYPMWRWLSEDEHSIFPNAVHDMHDLVSSCTTCASSTPPADPGERDPGVVDPGASDPESLRGRNVRPSSPTNNAMEIDLVEVGTFARRDDG
jgi:hypothetical protein